MDGYMRLMDDIARALSALRLPAVPCEHDVHELVRRALEQSGLRVEHEVPLGRGRRIDFMCQGVGIEVKVGKPARAALMGQLRRYALSDDVKALIVVAPGDMSLPREIGGVPVRCVALARLWGVALP